MRKHVFFAFQDITKTPDVYTQHVEAILGHYREAKVGKEATTMAASNVVKSPVKSPVKVLGVANR